MRKKVNGQLKTQLENENTTFDFYELLKKIGFKEGWMDYVYRNWDEGWDLWIYTIDHDKDKIIVTYVDFAFYPQDKYPDDHCQSILVEVPKSLAEAKKFFESWDCFDSIFISKH